MDTAMTDKPKPEGLALLREPFPANQISKLPKPTKRQTDDVKADYKQGIRCLECGQWHHPKVVHLDYVGHAALTNRLLDCDPEWDWQPMAVDESGLPKLSGTGMWIRLTVCGVTRIGYGDAEGKTGWNAIKEIIGDALRNAAMRFGAALDLWHKGQLHVDEDGDDPIDDSHKQQEAIEAAHNKERAFAISRLSSAPDLAALQTVWRSLGEMQKDQAVIDAKEDFKGVLQAEVSAAPIDDNIPY